MFKKFYKNIYSLPALILHELSHVFVSTILGGKLKSVEVSGCVVRLNISNLRNLTQVRLVAMAPILVPLTFIGLSFVDISFTGLVVYLATVFKTTLPSPTDFKTSKFNVPKFLMKK
jgi:hypothetical protein